MGKCPKENECKWFGADCSDGEPDGGCFEPHDTTIAKESRKQIVDRWIAQGYTDFIRMTKLLPKSNLPWLRKEGQKWLKKGFEIHINIQSDLKFAGWRTAKFTANIAKEPWGYCLVAWYLIDLKKARDI